MTSGRAIVAVIGFLTWLSAGCSADRGDRLPVFPVRGKLAYDAPPAHTAMVVFHPVGVPHAAAGKPWGFVQQDGTFRVSTYEANDGAPLGEYAVTVHWQIADSDGEAGRDLLSASAYADPRTTPLKVSIKPGPNLLATWRLGTTRTKPSAVLAK